MLHLSEFTQLIRSLPIDRQAFWSKKTTWSRYKRNTTLRPLIDAIFGARDEVLISRGDLRRYARKRDLSMFVLATIMWGYPRGMRGNHVQTLSQQMPDLVERLRKARTSGIADWPAHGAGFAIKGIGCSTYSKLLHFLDVQVCGEPALILDERLIRLAARRVFSELVPLSDLTVGNALGRYAQYLKIMHGVARNLDVDPAALDLFLFMFGGNLSRR